MDDGSVALLEHPDRGSRGKNGGIAADRPIERRAVAGDRPRDETVVEDQRWHVVEDDEGTGRQVTPRPAMATLRLAVEALCVQSAIHRVGARPVAER
jgi:hypothetical protein